MIQSLPTPFLTRLASFIPSRKPGRRPCMDTSDDTRARRAFISEKLEYCPHSFSSEHDVAAFMQVFPDRF